MRARPDVDLKRRIHGRSVSCGRRMDVVLMPKGSEWPRKKSSSYAFKRRSYFLRKPASRGRYRHTTRSSCRYETLWKEDGSERGTATRMSFSLYADTCRERPVSAYNEKLMSVRNLMERGWIGAT